MWFNSKIRAEPYQHDMFVARPRDWFLHLVGRNTGAAWLSPARVVRCWVKSRNGATPTFSCHHLVGHFKRTASDKLEEGGMTSVLAALTCWATRATMALTMGFKK